MDPENEGIFPADDFAAIFFGFPLLLFATAMPSRARGLLLYLGIPISAALFLIFLRACLKSRRRQLEPDKTAETYKPLKSQNVTKELPIPESYVGYVIGRGGMRIKKIQDDCSVRIFFKDAESEAENMRTTIISGGPENVSRAEAAIKQLIHEKQTQPEPIKVVIPIPNEFIGKIIGKQGSTIRQLQKESGSRISVDRTTTTNTKKNVTIEGRPNQVDYACQLLKELLDQCSPRTTPTPRSDPPYKPILRPAELPQTTSSEEPLAVKITSVEADGTLWLQVINEHLQKLDSLVVEMTQYYEGGGRVLSQQTPGDFCAARFELDNSWYRAKLVELNENGKWDVVYVDYGDCGTWSRDQLMELRPQFCELRCQAVRCQLAHIQYNESPLSSECLDTLDQFAFGDTQKDLRVIAVDKDHDPILVSIEQVTGSESTNLASELVKLGFATWNSESKVEEETQSASFRFSPVNNTDETDSPASKGKISRIVDVCASSKDEIDLGNGGEYSLREKNVLQSKYFIRGTDLTSVVIEWNDVRATTVAVEGSFTDGVQEKLTKNGDVFTGTFRLPVGCHTFVFVVDGERTHRPDMPVVEGGEENDCPKNYIVVEHLDVPDS